jgi:hydroxymethylbilane synthase
VGIECRADDDRVTALLRAIDHADTSGAVAAERAFTLALGGTCHSPVAALARVDGGTIDFRCELFSEDGAEHIADTARFAVGDADAPAMLATAMLARAPDSIRRLFGAE